VSYTRDRDARRRRLKARGIAEVDRTPKTSTTVKCATCGDSRQVVVQGRGLVPCPDCSGAA
jgi:hypothetical protein